MIVFAIIKLFIFSKYKIINKIYQSRTIGETGNVLGVIVPLVRRMFRFNLLVVHLNLIDDSDFLMLRPDYSICIEGMFYFN